MYVDPERLDAYNESSPDLGVGYSLLYGSILNLRDLFSCRALNPGETVNAHYVIRAYSYYEPHIPKAPSKVMRLEDDDFFPPFNKGDLYYVSQGEVDVPITYDETNVITGLTDVAAEPDVVSVRYYDANGRSSLNPFDGMNVVVTTRSDGSVKVVKMVK